MAGHLGIGAEEAFNIDSCLALVAYELDYDNSIVGLSIEVWLGWQSSMAAMLQLLLFFIVVVPIQSL